MKYKEVDLRELFEVMQEFNVTEVTLNDGKTVVEVKRRMDNLPLLTRESPVPSNRSHSFETHRDRHPSHLQENPGGSDTMPELEIEKTPAVEEKPDPAYHITKAPLVGTFYRASSPDADPFVNVGDRVAKGDVLCIIEAMKSMNEILAEAGGIIKEICVENADLVEFDQSLFKIDTKG